MSGIPTFDQLIKESLDLERSSEIGAALSRARDALKLAEVQGEPLSQAEALLNLARIQFRLGHYQGMKQSAEKVLTLVPGGTSPSAEAWLWLGAWEFMTSTLTEVEDCLRRSADQAREAGDHLIRMRALHNLSSGVYLPRGQFDLALAADEEAYRLTIKRSLPEWTVFPLITIAWNHFLTGQRDRASKTLDELRQIVPPNSGFEGYYLCISAALTLEEGEVDKARTLFADARSIAEATGEPWLNIALRLGMSRLQRSAGDLSSARGWAGEARDLAARLGYRHEHGRALVEHARCAWLSGDLESAESELRDAVRVLSELGATFDLAQAHFILAAFLFNRKSPEAAAVWGEAAREILDGNFGFILDQERRLAYPLIAAHLNSADATLVEMSSRCVEHLQRVPPQPLRITTLGTFEVWQGVRRVPPRILQKRRAGDLLSLLLLQPSRMLWFDQIADALWMDKNPTSAQSLFHQATSALRRALEPEIPEKFPSRYLKVEEKQVALYLPSGSSVDFEVFEDSCLKGEWETALGTYQGDFLPGYLYAEWTAAPRERLRRLYLRALLVTAHRHTQSGLAREALDLCCRILENDPWQEEAVLLGMQACMAFGDRSRAIRMYQVLEKVLEKELGVAPQDELREYYLQISK